MSENLNFRNRLDKELSEIVLSDTKKLEVLEKVGKSHGRLGYLLNLEIRIPLKPMAAALLITVSGFVFSFVGVTRVTDSDLKKSRIIVIDNTDGRSSYDSYKD